ncbi:formate dehydrogenase accessory sulfurtransferase FdhD [Siccirubricoccus sp. KC 17139]|uniref:Sulfur carrier protein FdhD n=1 Tax=Siccirubricoccus soli TaxID=2899147 RepID=A0ABT1CZJ6_9PROT|nr:formate dehydrogenase accessory sulfurtransferase FdhD [Siccirubricoccus soli]MCO6415069.1 formate dehydrogenase accessory sulfurtransferase FdhD [Siccirubricoccus soli]MCP2681200.1 formate dehydrogenase accessory sulfurtransferase FdhD [Siccirubricoccus soli]
MDLPTPPLPTPVQAVATETPDGPGARLVAEEVAVALTCGGATHAVMMATPAALEDFALGFCLTEGIVARPEELLGLTILQRPRGIELRLELEEAQLAAFRARRRRMAGALGCGLCGVESLEAALRPLPRLRTALRLAPEEVPQAVAALGEAQALHRLTHGVHAAGFWVPGRGLVAAREDVGRHNALDKLAGALARAGEDRGRGAVVLTSRVSVELVQKAATLGVPVLVAVSAPTTLAIRTAEACGMTLIACVRGARWEVFTQTEGAA